MPDHDDGVIDALQAQRTRPRRQAPRHRPAAGATRPIAITTPASQDPTATGADDAGAAPDLRQSPTVGHARTDLADAPARLRLAADEPSANYAVRVRRTLDDQVAWRLAQLRRQGVRSSKVELTEMLLWELAQAQLDQIAKRLRDFRAHAPR